MQPMNNRFYIENAEDIVILDPGGQGESKGGPGSGNWGHSGRPGSEGGSIGRGRGSGLAHLQERAKEAEQLQPATKPETPTPAPAPAKVSKQEHIDRILSQSTIRPGKSKTSREDIEYALQQHTSSVLAGVKRIEVYNDEDEWRERCIEAFGEKTVQGFGASAVGGFTSIDKKQPEFGVIKIGPVTQAMLLGQGNSENARKSRVQFVMHHEIGHTAWGLLSPGSRIAWSEFYMQGGGRVSDYASTSDLEAWAESYRVAVQANQYAKESGKPISVIPSHSASYSNVVTLVKSISKGT